MDRNMQTVMELAQTIPGFPSFQEFAANPEKYKGRADELFQCAEEGSSVLKNSIEKHCYYLETALGSNVFYRVDKLETLERIVSDEGLDASRDLDMRVEMEQGSMNGKYINHVKFFRKPHSGLILPR
jgi:hypothetical protein